MTPVEFVRFYGVPKFKRDWPAIRAKLPNDAIKYASVFDLARSRAVGGGWNLRPTKDYISMPDERRAFLTQVAYAPRWVYFLRPGSKHLFAHVNLPGRQ